ncbi:ABC transporter ATP-binding protein [Spiroplasma helicoides]|uniref:ABC transporter ATP-binding protein n=1 Tax=Spiroplasma helicoides TaxID=216938 RepID=A0A1B3SKH9_9MOLU|nr:ATP-binding cassette domain-containing protein [Spiroplasma helicoides]AOG60440.1 ABC transporter ATP-binding protein [Spiroplasma helicoides]
MVELKNVVKSYKKRAILDIEYFKLEENQCLGIIGHNGSGKTTLGEILIGVLRQNSGEVIFEDNSIIRNAVFQNFLIPYNYKLLKIANFYRDIFNSKEDLKPIFENLDLNDFKTHKYNKLSEGEKQKFKLLIASQTNQVYNYLMN